MAKDRVAGFNAPDNLLRFICGLFQQQLVTNMDRIEIRRIAEDPALRFSCRVHGLETDEEEATCDRLLRMHHGDLYLDTHPHAPRLEPLELLQSLPPEGDDRRDVRFDRLLVGVYGDRYEETRRVLHRVRHWDFTVAPLDRGGRARRALRREPEEEAEEIRYLVAIQGLQAYAPVQVWSSSPYHTLCVPATPSTRPGHPGVFVPWGTRHQLGEELDEFVGYLGAGKCIMLIDRDGNWWPVFEGEYEFLQPVRLAELRMTEPRAPRLLQTRPQDPVRRFPVELRVHELPRGATDPDAADRLERYIRSLQDELDELRAAQHVYDQPRLVMWLFDDAGEEHLHHLMRTKPIKWLKQLEHAHMPLARRDYHLILPKAGRGPSAIELPTSCTPTASLLEHPEWSSEQFRVFLPPRYEILPRFHNVPSEDLVTPFLGTQTPPTDEEMLVLFVREEDQAAPGDALGRVAVPRSAFQPMHEAFPFANSNINLHLVQGQSNALAELESSYARAEERLHEDAEELDEALDQVFAQITDEVVGSWGEYEGDLRDRTTAAAAEAQEVVGHLVALAEATAGWRGEMAEELGSLLNVLADRPHILGRAVLRTRPRARQVIRDALLRTASTEPSHGQVVEEEADGSRDEQRPEPAETEGDRVRGSTGDERGPGPSGPAAN